MTPEELQELLEEHRRRDGESLGEYARRMRRKAERDDRRDARREHWSKVLFGKKDKDDDG